MVEIRKIITTREMVLSELGVTAPRPVVPEQRGVLGGGFCKRFRETCYLYVQQSNWQIGQTTF
jgi:hypothetical protein